VRRCFKGGGKYQKSYIAGDIQIKYYVMLFVKRNEIILEAAHAYRDLKKKEVSESRLTGERKRDNDPQIVAKHSFILYLMYL